METYWILLIGTAFIASSSQEYLSSEVSEIETSSSDDVSLSNQYVWKRKLDHQGQAKEHNLKKPLDMTNKRPHARKEQNPKTGRSKIRDLISRIHKNKHGNVADSVETVTDPNTVTDKDLINQNEYSKSDTDELTLAPSVAPISAATVTIATEIIKEDNQYSTVLPKNIDEDDKYSTVLPKIIDEDNKYSTVLPVKSKSVTGTSNEQLIQDVNGFLEGQSIQENVDGILDSFSTPDKNIVEEKSGRRSADGNTTGSTGTDEITGLMDDMLRSSLKSVTKFDNIKGIVNNLLNDRSGRRSMGITQCSLWDSLRYIYMWVKSLIGLKVLALRGIEYNEFETIEAFKQVTYQLKPCFRDGSFFFGLINIGGRIGMFFDRLFNKLLGFVYRTFIGGRSKRSIVQDTELFIETSRFNKDFEKNNNLGSLKFLNRKKRDILDVFKNFSGNGGFLLKIGTFAVALFKDLVRMIRNYFSGH